MKQIIVPTDFSVPAENAMLYAGQLAEKTGAGILLLHVFQIPVSMSEVPVLMISAEELKHNADIGLNKTKEILAKSYPSITVRTESRMGDVTDELKDVCREIDTMAIVTGKHGAGGVERFFFGSTSSAIVRHAQAPVIVVPENAIKKEVRSIALAIDEKEQLPHRKIRNFVEALGAQLHVIHVQPQKTSTKEFNTVVEGLNIVPKTIRDDEFLHGIQTYLKENNIDMLMILPHKHSFLERLTFRTHTEELLRKLDIPLVCINEKE